MELIINDPDEQVLSLIRKARLLQVAGFSDTEAGTAARLRVADAILDAYAGVCDTLEEMDSLNKP